MPGRYDESPAPACSRLVWRAGCSAASTRSPANYSGPSSCGRPSPFAVDVRYASSPIAFRDTIVVPVGGRGKAVMAFNQADGKVLWSANDFGNAYSSPVLINVAGLEHMALLMDGAMIAINPHNRDLQWRVPFKAEAPLMSRLSWMPRYWSARGSAYAIAGR